MEKDNKKARDDARKEYNDTVKVSRAPNSSRSFIKLRQSLVAFIRKRDPRYRMHQERQKELPSSSSGLSEAAKDAAQKRADAVQAFILQDWQRVKESVAEEDFDEQQGAEEWECVACDRTFRSEPAWHSHERSRKHLKAVEMCGMLPLD